MKKVTLTVDKLFVLKNELQGLLKATMTIAQRFSLKEIQKSVDEHLKIAIQTQDDLIKKYGTEDEKGNIVVERNSENFKIFLKEWKEVLDIQKEVSLPTFDKELFSQITTDVDLEVIFELI